MRISPAVNYYYFFPPVFISYVSLVCFIGCRAEAIISCKVLEVKALITHHKIVIIEDDENSTASYSLFKVLKANKGYTTVLTTIIDELIKY